MNQNKLISYLLISMGMFFNNTSSNELDLMDVVDLYKSGFIGLGGEIFFTDSLSNKLSLFDNENQVIESLYYDKYYREYIIKSYHCSQTFTIENDTLKFIEVHFQLKDSSDISKSVFELFYVKEGNKINGYGSNYLLEEISLENYSNYKLITREYESVIYKIYLFPNGRLTYRKIKNILGYLFSSYEFYTAELYKGNRPYFSLYNFKNPMIVMNKNSNQCFYTDSTIMIKEMMIDDIDGFADEMLDYMKEDEFTEIDNLISRYADIKDTLKYRISQDTIFSVNDTNFHKIILRRDEK